MESKRKRKVSVKSNEEDEISTKLAKTTSKNIDRKLGNFKTNTELKQSKMCVSNQNNLLNDQNGKNDIEIFSYFCLIQA